MLHASEQPKLLALKKYIRDFTSSPPHIIKYIDDIIKNHKVYANMQFSDIIHELNDPPNPLITRLNHFKMTAHLKDSPKEFMQIIGESLSNINMDQIYNLERTNNIKLFVHNIRDYVCIITILQIFFNMWGTETYCHHNIPFTDKLIKKHKLIDNIIRVYINTCDNTFINIKFVNYSQYLFPFDFIECTLIQKANGSFLLGQNDSTISAEQALKNIRDKKLTPIYANHTMHTAHTTHTTHTINIIKIWNKANRLANAGFTFLAPLQCDHLLLPTYKYTYDGVHIITNFFPPVLTDIIIGYILMDPLCEICGTSNNSFLVNSQKIFPILKTSCINCFRYHVSKLNLCEDDIFFMHT